MFKRPIASKRDASIGLLILAAGQWYFPNFAGLLGGEGTVSQGEGHIIASILFVGAVILYYLPINKD